MDSAGLLEKAFGVCLLAGTLGLAPSAAYYHYVHYTKSTAPYNPVQEKFDLNALPGKILTFLVSDSGPTQYSGTDSFVSVLSQVRQATAVWNSVETSDLRVAFGGLTTPGTAQSTPGGLVVFEDLPPGWLASSTRTTGDMTGGSNPFVPITQGVVHINRNLAVKPGPSYLESFFTTVVHEMGHALGLQHTFCSSAMSTSITRSTSRAKPLDADDVAAISLLYPSRGFANAFGSISGRVTSAGQGLHMASVVALRPNGPAVSALTNPDGTYRIDGLAPDESYWVYVHPLPPTADIQPPVDPGGQPVLPASAFETVFYQKSGAGTRDPSQFSTVTVKAGNTTQGIDFSVQKRNAVQVYDVASFSYIVQSYVSPAYLDFTTQGSTNRILVAKGTGLLNAGNPLNGLSAQLLGGFNSTGTAAFDSGTSLAIYLPQLPGSGPRHLLLTWPGDAYVLPSAVISVQKQPSISSVSSNGDGSVTVSGSNFGADTRIFFDGLPGTVQTSFSGNDKSGTVVVVPPQGASNQVATITAFNSDGQNSMFLQPQPPPVHNYGSLDTPAVTVTPAALPAGSSAMLEITLANGRFAEGQVSLGFGSSDVTVRRLWIVSPTRMLANVTVPSNAQTGASQFSVISGFLLYAQPSGFQVQPPSAKAPSIALPVTNASSAQSPVYPGAPATITGSNLTVSPGSATLTLNGQPAQVLYADSGQINFMVPASTATGPAILRLNNGAEPAPPVLVQIDPAPPLITAITTGSNVSVDALHPVAAGDRLYILIVGVDPGVTNAPSRLRVTFGGVEAQVLGLGGGDNVIQAHVVVPPSVPGPFAPVTVSVDGGTPSGPFYIPVR